MLKRANISWNARQLSKMIEKGTIVFDSAIQRNLVWDDKRKSLLIHSMLEGYPIPPMYAAKENGSYSFLDGKQRCNAINDFLCGKFTLTDIPEVTLEDGAEIDINGMYFSGLNEELQDALNTYSFTIYYFEDITEDEVSEMFFRLNFGKPLSAIELSRAKAKSLKTIQKIGEHELYKSALTEKAFEKYTHEDLVIKSYIMLTSDTPCLDTKFVRPIMETTEFTDDDINLLNAVYDRILNTYKTIVSDTSEETGKISKRIAKRLLTRTHMLSIMPIVKTSLEENVSDEMFTNWVKNFFCGKKSATKYDSYNSRCTSGSGHAENVKVRLSVIKKDYEKFMSQFRKDDEVSEINKTEMIKEIKDIDNVKKDFGVVTDIVTDDKSEDVVITDTETNTETTDVEVDSDTVD